MKRNNVTILKIDIREENFDSGFETKLLSDNCLKIGAVVTFLGLVRDVSKNCDLQFMEIEHYPGMSEKVLRDICDKAVARWDLTGISLIHRIGKLYPGENIVLLAIASSHRREAFDASVFIMDFLKSKAPFWKKETTLNGTSWVKERKEDEQKALGWSLSLG